jgi:cytochrome b561
MSEAANAAASTAPSMRSDAGMSQTWWTRTHPVCGAAILAILVWRLGATASLEGVACG